MKYLVPALLIAMSSFFGFSAQAAEDGKEKPRYFIGDQIFTPNDNGYGRRDYRSANATGNRQYDWYKISTDLGVTVLPAPAKSSYDAPECLYDLPFKILQDIRDQLGAANTYQKIWVENQNRVYSACDERSGTAESVAPVESKAPDLPARAKSDFLYQLASWNFYHEDNKAAQKLYEQVAADKEAPMRPYASYMLLRVLHSQEKDADAYKLNIALLADPTMKPAYDLIENYRFVLGWDHSGPDPMAHLEWLVSLLQTTSKTSADLNLVLANKADATRQLSPYFPSQKDEVDWWLTGKPQESKRMEAVRTLAPKYEIVDWMQATWADDWFDESWLWALHKPDDKYWGQNQNIVNHAWARWKNGDGMEWLQIAASRVHPKDPLAGEILAAMSPYLTDEMKAKYGQHKTWQFDLWSQSIRLHLGRDENSDAMALVKSRSDIKGTNGVARRDGTYAINVAHVDTLSSAIGWLYYTGQYDEARALLAQALAPYPSDFQHWSTILATEWGRTVMLHQSPPENQYAYYDAYKAKELWIAMTNSLSTSEMADLAKPHDMFETITYSRAYSRAALTRAFLLNENYETLKKYAVIAAERNPRQREALLKIFETNNRYAFISFLVRNPRWRPLPYGYLDGSYASREQNLDSEFSKYDRANPRDNNWWCTVDANALDEAMLDAAFVGPTDSYIHKYTYRPFSDHKTPDPEFKARRDMQREFLMHHPYREHVDLDKMKKLQAPAQVLNFSPNPSSRM